MAMAGLVARVAAQDQAHALGTVPAVPGVWPICTRLTSGSDPGQSQSPVLPGQ